MVAAAETQPPVAQSGASPNGKEAATKEVATEAVPEEVKEKTVEEQKAEAFSSLAAGKRHLLVSDIPLAVSTLGEACELLAKVFGETASECGEVYFYYGKALLEMARLESGVLGNALDGVPEGDDADNSQVENPEKMTDEEKGEVEEKVEEALEENFEKHDKIAKIHNGENGQDGDEETEDGESEESPEEEDEKSNDADKAAEDAEKPKEGSDEAMETDKAENGDDDVEGGDKEAEDKSALEQEEEEDPSNLQLAWEMLELAKVVYTKTGEGQSSKDAELEKRLCETYMVLGEVSLENENYPQAVEDLTICLKRRTDTLPADSRCIAETHYQLGIALGFDMKWEEAVTSLEAAIKVLETRVANLKAETESPDEAKKEDAFYTREKEVAELEALIPDIKEKITDTNEMKAESLRKMKEAVGFTSGSATSGASSSSVAGASTSSGSSPKPVSTIAIKRKAEDKEEDSKGEEVKKPKEDATA